MHLINPIKGGGRYKIQYANDGLMKIYLKSSNYHLYLLKIVFHLHFGLQDVISIPFLPLDPFELGQIGEIANSLALISMELRLGKNSFLNQKNNNQQIALANCELSWPMPNSLAFRPSLFKPIGRLLNPIMYSETP